ncbi:MAG: class I SAM-dependent methyltransferase [Armatimonadota bacterium]|nr:class I SAM-dependent methyltransferase [Armatimonadota bacterium]MDR7496640.1 class I SAM-dependent methyltransferase [Armatimonadota bacterium]
MDELHLLLDHYPGAPWLALLRAIEVRKFACVRGLCKPPVLDLGCGDGRVASMAFETPLDVGLDADTSVLNRAAVQGAYRVLVAADSRRLPFADGCFHTVYSNGALEHMDDLNAVLAEVARVTAVGGALVALVPSAKFRVPVGILGKLMGRRVWEAFNRLHNHVNLLTSEEWCRYLESHGLRVREVRSYGGPAVAGYVSTRDLWSKVHLTATWPVVRFAHGGNLGRFMPPSSRAALQRLFDDDGAGRDGYWLLVVAERRALTARLG